MQWWLIALLVWGTLDVLLSLNYIIRKVVFRDERLSVKAVFLAFYDSAYWPLFLVFYGIEGIWREITGRPW